MMTARGPIGAELLDQTDAGDLDAEAVVCLHAADCLMRGDLLPEPLAYFVSDVLFKKALSSENERNYQNLTRNIFAVHAIAQLSKKFGLHATRGRNKHHSSENPSACTYVAEKLGEKESTIQDVWEKKRRRYRIFD